MSWQRSFFRDFHEPSQYASVFVIVTLQPAVREEHGKKIPKYHARWEAPYLSHTENCTLCKHPSTHPAGQGAVERSQVFWMTLSPLALQISFNILVNIFLPKDQRRMAEVQPRTGSATCAKYTAKHFQKHQSSPVHSKYRRGITQRLPTVTAVTWGTVRKGIFDIQGFFSGLQARPWGFLNNRYQAVIVGTYHIKVNLRHVKLSGLHLGDLWEVFLVAQFRLPAWG